MQTILRLNDEAEININNVKTGTFFGLSDWNKNDAWERDIEYMSHIFICYSKLFLACYWK